MQVLVGVSAAVLLALGTPARAQSLPSIAPVLIGLDKVIEQLEANKVQVLGLGIHIVRSNHRGSDVTLELAPQRTMVVAVGDTRAVSDLDMLVEDPNGVVLARDDLADPVPTAQFDPKMFGPHTIRVLVAESVGRATESHFFVVHGTPSGGQPITARPVVQLVSQLAKMAEDAGYTIVGGQMSTLSEGESDVLDLPIKSGTYADCAAFLAGSPDRVKELSLEVFDANLTQLERGKETAGTVQLAEFVNDELNPHHYLRYTAVTTKRGYGDAHVMLAVGCRPLR